ncbi:MAG TPA: signal peptidase I [Bacteroidales bacterium]|nr:signal peptidase I [Bacteroidales bacterium]
MSPKTKQYLRFSYASVIIILFGFWFESFWLPFLHIPMFFDLFITKKIIRFNYPIFKKPNFKFAWTIFIAIIIASALRLLFIEVYTIPTSSMERKLLVGDYLFVSKLSYGPRLAVTPLALPFMHHYLPFTQIPSYIASVQTKPKRLKGLGKIERNDLVVFNFPEGDSVLNEFPDQSYYTLKRIYDEEFLRENYTYGTRPIDRRDNYIKRCVAIPNDTLEIRAGKLFINGKAENGNEYIQYDYYILVKDSGIPNKFLKNLQISERDIEQSQKFFAQETYDRSAMSFIATNPPFRTAEYTKIHILPLTEQAADVISKHPNVVAVKRYSNTPAYRNSLIFPHDENFLWNEDFFGALVVPGKGKTVQISIKNLPLYRRIIAFYENNSLEIRNDTIFINKMAASEYTFKMNYYFMLGDNRHNSADSRYWGFVPENHVVGKAIGIWFSINTSGNVLNFVRWNRTLDRIN